MNETKKKRRPKNKAQIWKQFDLENESIEDFYNVIKAYESIDELKGDYFSLLPSKFSKIIYR